MFFAPIRISLRELIQKFDHTGATGIVGVICAHVTIAL